MSEKPIIDWKNRDSVLAAVGRWPDQIGDEILATLEQVGLLAAGKTADLAPVGTGAAGGLANSISAGRPLSTPVGWKISWGTTADHAETIEHGRAPGSTPPPIEEIARWAYTKAAQLGIETKIITRGDRKGQRETEEEAALRVAYPIAKKIARHGFSSGPVAGDAGGTAWKMFERAAKEIKPEVDAAFEDCKQRIEAKLSGLGV